MAIGPGSSHFSHPCIPAAHHPISYDREFVDSPIPPKSTIVEKGGMAISKSFSPSDWEGE